MKAASTVKNSMGAYGAEAALNDLLLVALRLNSGGAAGTDGHPRRPGARRFGPGVLLRLDRATGAQLEQISPLATPPRYCARMSLPEPIGLEEDMMGVTARSLERLGVRVWTEKEAR